MSQYLQYPNEIAARNASKAALNRVGELHAGNVTQYLWPVWEGEDGKWYMEITQHPSTAKYRNTSIDFSDIPRLLNTAPLPKEVEV